MKPSDPWLALWSECRDKLECPNDLGAYFTQAEIAGKDLDTLVMGTVSLPTGQVMVRDPLCYLDRREEPYFLQLPTGEFQVSAAVVKPDSSDCARYAAVRVRFNEQPVARYEEALIGFENLGELEEGEYFGFYVESGLACICDVAVRDAFCTFVESWRREHPRGNLYDDYFAPFFIESHRQHPRYQRQSGDWVDWIVPGTDYHLPIFQSGFGDGTYPTYIGFDAQGGICQLMIQFIDIEMAYGQPSERLSIEDFDVMEGMCEGDIYLDLWEEFFDYDGPYGLAFTSSLSEALEEFSQEQRDGYDYIIQHQMEILDAILEALLEEYPALQEQYGYEGEEKEELMPDITRKEDLVQLIAPTNVVIHDVVSEDGIPYVGYEFNCSWDDEHAFGAMVHKTRVVEVGGADTALLEWIAQADLDRQEGR